MASLAILVAFLLFRSIADLLFIFSPASSMFRSSCFFSSPSDEFWTAVTAFG